MTRKIELQTEMTAVVQSEKVEPRVIGTFVLPLALTEEKVASEQKLMDSESYTSRIYRCCT